MKNDDFGNILCVESKKQEGCLTYNNIDKDECSVCDEGYIMLNQTTNCLAVNISGCVSYVS